MIAEIKQYNAEEVLEELHRFCSKFRTKGEAADALGVNRVFLWRVEEGKSPPSERILTVLGFTSKRTITYSYQKVKKDA